MRVFCMTSVFYMDHEWWGGSPSCSPYLWTHFIRHPQLLWTLHLIMYSTYPLFFYSGPQNPSCQLNSLLPITWTTPYIISWLPIKPISALSGQGSPKHFPTRGKQPTVTGQISLATLAMWANSSCHHVKASKVNGHMWSLPAGAYWDECHGS